MATVIPLVAAFGANLDFDNFNFSSLSSCLEGYCRPVSDLIALVVYSREDDPGSIYDFANAMYFTLRPAAFEAYQRVHVPVAISYEDWFYLKLRQFLRILLFDEIEVKNLIDGSRKWQSSCIGKGLEVVSIRCPKDSDLDELEEYITPEHNDWERWLSLAERICYCPDNRLQELREWLKKHRRASRGRATTKIGWTKNQARNEVIRKEMSRGTERVDICRKLDERRIDPTPGLQGLGFKRWLDAWSDAEGRQSVQTLFSKVGRR